MEKTKFKILRKNGTLKTELNGEVFKVSTREELEGNYFMANYQLLDSKTISLFNVEKTKKFDSSFKVNQKNEALELGAFFELDRIRGEIMGLEISNGGNVKKYKGDEIGRFIKQNRTRVLRFYDLDAQGDFLVNILESNGFSQSFNRLGLENSKNLYKGEYSALMSDVGKYYAISFKNETATTTIMDVKNIAQGKNIADALDGFGLDSSGHNSTDAVNLYRAFMSQDIFSKHLNKKEFLTIGSVAWTTFLSMTYGHKSPEEIEVARERLTHSKDTRLNRFMVAFKDHVGDWSLEHDIHFRANLYRGGYNLLNYSYYNKDLKNFVYSDINSAYPDILRNYKLCGKLIREGSNFEIDRRKGYMYIYDIVIDTAILKDGKFPYIINGRKKQIDFIDEFSNYVYNTRQQIKLSLFDFELKKALEVYEVLEYEIVRVYECEEINGNAFADFVDYFFNEKQNNERGTVAREVSKLILNALTGKIGENPVRSKVIVNRDEKGALRPLEVSNSESYGVTRSVPLIASITARLRDRIYTLAESLNFYDVALIATDAIIYKENGKYFKESDNIGGMENKKLQKIMFNGEKMYQYIDEEGYLTTVAGGINEEAQLSLDYGDLKPGLKLTVYNRKKVEGGNILVANEIELSESLGGFKCQILEEQKAEL